MLCTADFEAHAREVLTKETWDYYAGGSNNEQTLKENVIAFSRYVGNLHTALINLHLVCFWQVSSASTCAERSV